MIYYPVVGLTPQERHNLIGNLVMRFEFDKTKDFNFDEATELLWVAVKAPFRVIDDTLWYDHEKSLFNSELFLTSQEQERVCVIAKKNDMDCRVDFDALKTCGKKHATLFYREVRVEVNNHFIPEFLGKLNRRLDRLRHADWKQDALNDIREKLELELQYNASAQRINILQECLVIANDIPQLESLYTVSTERADREAYFLALSKLPVNPVIFEILKEQLSPITKAYYGRDADAMLAHVEQQEKVMAAKAGGSPNSIMWSPSGSPVVMTNKRTSDDVVDNEDNEGNEDDVITLPDDDRYTTKVARFS